MGVSRGCRTAITQRWKRCKITIFSLRLQIGPLKFMRTATNYQLSSKQNPTSNFYFIFCTQIVILTICCHALQVTYFSRAYCLCKCMLPFHVTWNLPLSALGLLLNSGRQFRLWACGTLHRRGFWAPLLQQAAVLCTALHTRISSLPCSKEGVPCSGHGLWTITLINEERESNLPWRYLMHEEHEILSFNPSLDNYKLDFCWLQRI